jgi:uncharacterized RDD family membrane protein YckC
MDKQFIAIVQALVAKEGKVAFLDAKKCKSLLSDYAQNEYRKERHVLLVALEADVGKEIALTRDLALCKKIQIRHLNEERFIEEDVAVEVVNLLALVLRGDRTPSIATRAPQPTPITQEPSPPPPAFWQQPVDQSMHVGKEPHHPWRRLFARTVDICTTGLVLFVLLFVALSVTMPELAGFFAKAIENEFIGGVVLNLIWVPAEALLLSLFGTTPAKWLFGIRVVHADGTELSFSEALERSFLVFVQGEGLCIPLVALFTQLFAYRRLSKTGTTLWDTSTNAVVLHKKWGVLRALVCTAAVFAVLILVSALSAVGK